MAVCATVIVDTWQKVDGNGVVGYVVVGAVVIVGIGLIITVVVASCAAAAVGSASDKTFIGIRTILPGNVKNSD